MTTVLLAGILLAGPAMADDEPAVDPEEIAVLASTTHADNCADIYSSKLDTIAEGYHEVTDAWQAVDAGYKATSDPMLLFWRGQLALCLGQKELGQRDLQEFVENLDDEQRKRLRSMVHTAEKRLVRMERGADQPQGKRRGYQSRRFTVIIEVGPSYGPFHVRGTEVVVESDPGGNYRVDWLEPGWAFRVSLGFDARVYKALTWNLAFGITPADHFKDGWTFDSADAIGDLQLGTGDTVVEFGKNNWYELHTGPGVMWLPQRQVSPILRIAAWIRGYSKQDGGGNYDSMHGWTMGGFGVFVGLAIDSPKAPGFSIGCWINVDGAVHNVQENGNLYAEGTDALLTAAQEASSTVAVYPRLAARFNF